MGLEGSAIVSGISGVWGGFANDFSSLLQNIDTKKTPGIISATNVEVEGIDINKSDAIESHMTTTSQEQGHFNEFIRKMIQIKEILRISGNDDSINLPNIIVIGSNKSHSSDCLAVVQRLTCRPGGERVAPSTSDMDHRGVHLAAPAAEFSQQAVCGGERVMALPDLLAQAPHRDARGRRPETPRAVRRAIAATMRPAAGPRPACGWALGPTWRGAAPPAFAATAAAGRETPIAVDNATAAA